jgi:hypothetical protein
MRKTVLAVAVLIVAPAFAQEIQHAPTAEVCRADDAVWSDRFDSDKTALSYGELAKRKDEMLDCANVDPAFRSESGSTYRGMATLYALEMSKREEDFIARHGYVKQFYDEDAAGKR